ncbi:MAG: thioredoxin family protein [Anaerolineales bacterium]|nr:thioredoxin family protein [Anaerolineales bacterium]
MISTYRQFIKAIFGLCFSISILFVWVNIGLAQTDTPPAHPVNIYLFWGDGCSHCAITKPYLEGLARKYPGVVLKEYEVYYEEENQNLFFEIAAKYGIEPSAVPTFFIGNYYSVGYARELNIKIDAIVKQCLKNSCPDPEVDVISETPSTILAATLEEIMNVTPVIPATLTLAVIPDDINPGEIATIIEESTTPSKKPPETHLLQVPFFDMVDLDAHSITLSTALIAFVDGFNPCSLWVLSMLITLTLHTGSRRKVTIIGLVFLTVTAVIYALFIAGLFSVLKIASFYGWVQVIIALIALFFGLVNIKDYFWYKEGLSFTIADEKKSGIFRSIRKVMDASQSTWGLIGATIVLAAGVSMVEFSCTAGFPVLWTNLLTSQNIGAAAFLLLLLLYMLIYQLDELVIFFSAVVTLKSNRLEEKHGRLLKLIGGILMLTLAGVMLIDPGVMNSLTNSLAIFGFAFGATLLVLFVHRILLPKLGIRVGTEQLGEPSSKSTSLYD